MSESRRIQVSSAKGRPGFAIKVSGPRVGEARLSASDLATIILRSQQALKRIGQVLYGESSSGRGRKKREIEELCELFVIGWKPGSAIAEVELGEPPPQLNLFGYVGEQSLAAFLKGMESIKIAGAEVHQITPTGFDAGVLQACDALGQVLEHGIESITFESVQINGMKPVVYDRPLRERIRDFLGKPIDQRQAEKVGRLEVLNGHRGVQGQLWEPDGTKWLCVFKPEHVELLPDLWLHTVKIIGEAIIEPTHERTIKVDSVLPLEADIEEGVVSPIPESLPFWTSVSLYELVELQGVQPATDLDSISDLWPVDDDPDQLLSHILDERTSRRRITHEGHD